MKLQKVQHERLREEEEEDEGKQKRTFSRMCWNQSELTRGSPGRPVAVDLHQRMNVDLRRDEGMEEEVWCTSNPT